MVNTKFEAQRQTILHYWLNGIRSPKEIHELTSIPRRTIDYNIKKIKESDDVEHRRENGRSIKVTQTVSCAIGQFVH